MIRRIFVTALSCWAELAIDPGLVHDSFWDGWRADLLFAVACGGLALAVCEKLRIVLSQEKVDRELRPTSLFRTDDQDRQPSIPNRATHVFDIASEKRERQIHAPLGAF